MVKQNILVAIVFSGLIQFFSNNSAADQCSSFFERLLPLIHAPEKKLPYSPPSKIKEQWGYFPDEIELKPTTISDFSGNTQVHLLPEKFVIRVLPDSQTALGRYTSSIERKGGNVYLADDGVIPSGADGYFNPLTVFKSIDQQTLKFDRTIKGKSIVLSKDAINTQDFHINSMHEGFHHFSETLREKNIASPFNSYLIATDENIGLLSPYRIYGNRLHSEEVHTYANEFIHRSIKAHNRETIREIESQLKKLPNVFNRQQKLDRVKLSFDSVIDHQSYLESYVNLNQITRSHEANLSHIREEVLLYMKDHLSSKLVLSVTPDDRLVLASDKVIFAMNEVNARQLKVSGKKVDLKSALIKIDESIAIDREVLSNLKETMKVIDRSEKFGYFTATDYFKMKDQAARISKTIRVKGPQNKLPFEPVKQLGPGSPFVNPSKLPVLKRLFDLSD